MKIKEIHKKVVRDTFFYLLITTILISIYQHFNPLFFPNLKIKLIVVTLFFGIVWFCLTFIPSKKIWIHVKKVKDVKKKLMIFSIGFIFYSLFLNWIFPKLSFDEFMFFILLLYIPISFILGLDSRIPILIGLVLMIFWVIASSQEYKIYMERTAMYAYYFFVIGITLQFIGSFIKYENSEINQENILTGVTLSDAKDS